MAGMFYLPRLFVYHADAAKGSELSETLKVMERKLLRFIMNPAMILTWDIWDMARDVNWSWCTRNRGLDACEISFSANTFRSAWVVFCDYEAIFS